MARAITVKKTRDSNDAGVLVHVAEEWASQTLKVGEQGTGFYLEIKERTELLAHARRGQESPGSPFLIHQSDS